MDQGAGGSGQRGQDRWLQSNSEDHVCAGRSRLTTCLEPEGTVPALQSLNRADTCTRVEEENSMYRAIRMAGCLLLMVAPCARAVTINITEDKPNSLMVSADDSSLFKPYTAMALPIVPPPLAPRGWIIDTTSLPSDSFTFNVVQTNGPNFYFQEPDSAFVNAVSRTSTTTLQVVSDLATPTPA